MGKTATISIRTDATLKQQAEELFEALGMNMATAIHFFLRQSVRKQRIPFVIPRTKLAFDVDAAYEEAKRIARDPNVKGYANMEDLIKELES